MENRKQDFISYSPDLMVWRNIGYCIQIQKQARRLQLGSLMIHQSFQRSAEAFLVGVPLEGEYISAAPLFKNYK